MKTPLVLDVMFAHFPYGGNGGYASEHPDIRKWEVQTVCKMKKDPRVGEILSHDFVDTPITMTRNRAVRVAQNLGAHVLVMVDSDQSPNRHYGEPWFRPFWDTAFEELYNHYQKGPLILFAPYGGPPPFENVYVFQYENNMTGLGGDETMINLEQYTRAQASQMTGISEVGAGPTGLIMFDMRIFDLIKPSPTPMRWVLQQLREQKITIDEAEQSLTQGWFYYDWQDGYADQKSCTEDVTATRDLSLAASIKLGYNPLRCVWDSWIGHWKPWNVGRPSYLKVENVAASFKAVVERGQSALESTIDFRSDVLDDPGVLQRLMQVTEKSKGHDVPLIDNTPPVDAPTNGQTPSKTTKRAKLRRRSKSSRA